MGSQQNATREGADDLREPASTPNLDPVPTRSTWGASSSSSRATANSLSSSSPRQARSAGPSSSIFSSNISDAVRHSAHTITPSSSSRPLAALASASALSSSRRAAHFDTNMTISRSNERTLPRVEKDFDDPTSPSDSHRSLEGREYTTLTTLSRLFAAQTSPVASRAPSYTASGGLHYNRSMASDSASLPDHLFTKGLLGGRHSDITVVAFGHKYALHRLILDRAPFFTTALTGPWVESSVKEITLHPEDVDSNITQTSFELALKRLYGCNSLEEEDTEAIGLFATGCWLEMQALVDSSINSILRQLNPSRLSMLIKLVTANYYGRSGERILASAKSMLCRDGWEMPLRFWDGIPGDIVREIVGGDGFFVDSEWERWVLAKRLLDRRLRQKAVEAKIIEPGKKAVAKAPDTISLMVVRSDAVYRQNVITTERSTNEENQRWLNLYTNPDVEPLLVLLDEGIHYIHLDFEQLQYIRQSRDILGLPVLPEKVITSALWAQMELRQKVMSAGETDLELGLSKSVESQIPTVIESTPPTENEAIKGKSKVPDDESVGLEEVESESLDGKPRKFWIPSSDHNIVMGGNADPVVTTNSAFQRHATRLSATLQPEDLKWATDFAASPANPDVRPSLSARTSSAGINNPPQPKPIAYSHFPPFRFTAEFPNPRLLKEKKRVYSRTFFYAGSLWNIYVRKLRTPKNTQLGVYLHRTKERKTDELLAGAHGLGQASVDERIGLLEREMLLRSERRNRRQNRAIETMEQGGEEDTSGSGGDQDATLVSTGSRSPFGSGSLHRIRSARTHPNPTRPASDLTSGLFSFPNEDDDSQFETPSSSDTEPDVPNPSSLQPHSSSAQTTRQAKLSRCSSSTLPPYVDARPVIRTYFKIYSPSKGGRLLSMYESVPNEFDFTQCWGWKSSTLMLDDVPDASSGAGCSGGVGGDMEVSGGGVDAVGGQGGDSVRTDGKLRFVVVIGNL